MARRVTLVEWVWHGGKTTWKFYSKKQANQFATDLLDYVCTISVAVYPQI